MIWNEGKEHDEQVAIFEWWALTQKKQAWENLLFAIPNGGLRHKGVAGKLKAEGVRAGVPDIFLAWPAGKWHGLWIELKTKKGKLSPAQGAMLQELNKAGYRAEMARGWEDAVSLLCEYLGIESGLG